MQSTWASVNGIGSLGTRVSQLANPQLLCGFWELNPGPLTTSAPTMIYSWLFVSFVTLMLAFSSACSLLDINSCCNYILLFLIVSAFTQLHLFTWSFFVDKEEQDFLLYNKLFLCTHCVLILCIEPRTKCCITVLCPQPWNASLIKTMYIQLYY